MLITDTTTAAIGESTTHEGADLPAATAQADRTADIYRVNAAWAREGFRGAPDQAWLRSQSAVCVAREGRCKAHAEQQARGDQGPSRWRALALGYAEAAAVLAKAAEGATPTIPAALLAAAVLIEHSLVDRTMTISATAHGIDLAVLNTAYHEAREGRTARALRAVEAEMLLVASYARDHKQPLLPDAIQALIALADARSSHFADGAVTAALEITRTVVDQMVRDPRSSPVTDPAAETAACSPEGCTLHRVPRP